MEIKSKTFEHLYDLSPNVRWKESDEMFLFDYHNLAVVDGSVCHYPVGKGETKTEAKKDYLEKISHQTLVLRVWPNPNVYIKPLVIVP